MTSTHPGALTRLRLIDFKSYRDATLDLDDFTLVVGRNGSGKSNALDGLWVLSQLAAGAEIRDALEGSGGTVRGGVAGCAPFGRTGFALGCTVAGDGGDLELEVEIQVDPRVQVARERLAHNGTTLYASEPPESGRGDIEVAWNNRRPGRNPQVIFRSSELLCTQVLSRIPADTDPGRALHRAAEQVLRTLRAVFVLDPVPHRMRQYVPRRDTRLRRDARNLSATVAALLQSPHSRESLRRALATLNEQHIADIGVSASDLDDVMLRLHEGRDGHAVSARVMSDGSLRFLAILAALMQAPTVSVPGIAADDPGLPHGQTTVVVEEIENGLHASQAATLVDEIRCQVAGGRVRALATGHSPALVDTLTGDEHRKVVVCQRDRDGHSTLSRLVDLPAYFQIVGAGTLGRALSEDRMRTGQHPAASAVLDRLLRGDL